MIIIINSKSILGAGLLFVTFTLHYLIYLLGQMFPTRLYTPNWCGETEIYKILLVPMQMPILLISDFKKSVRDLKTFGDPWSLHIKLSYKIHCIMC